MKRLRLAHVFVLSAALVIALVAALLVAFLAGSRRAIEEGASARRAGEANRVKAEVQRNLDVAKEALGEIERLLTLQVVDASDSTAVERLLSAELASHGPIEEITLTRANQTEVSVFRPGSNESLLRTRVVRPQGSAFVATLRERPTPVADAGADLAPAKDLGESPATDPTSLGAFTTPISPEFEGRPIVTDLSWAPSDRDLPTERRRAVRSVLQSLKGKSGQDMVLAVSLFESSLDAIVQRREDESDPSTVFLYDDQRRLLTRTNPANELRVVGDDLRPDPKDTPHVITKALELASVTPEPTSARFEVDGSVYLATFKKLASNKDEDVDWFVGVVVAERAYAKDFAEFQRMFATAVAAVAALILVAALLTLRALRRGLGEIVQATARMRQLDFRATASSAPFRDVDEVLDSLERAKTTMRALEKYVPVDVVRQLFRANVDPVLGGEPRVLSMMFTDIEGFTSLSEKLPPQALAEALGRYLDAMTVAIQRTEGTIDKFIGDAVMALWNAPSPVADHPRKACEAVCACRASTAALYASPAWKGLAPLITRFGLHTGEVLVGHFGAPARLSYTALGDGVNLAARLESLGKQYGVEVIASDAVREAVGDGFVFRTLDVVAVKGKKRGVKIHELLGRAGEAKLTEAMRSYEVAFEAYLAQDFTRARALLLQHPEDPPSQVLARRCESLLASPPGEGWDGVYVATSK